MTRLRDEAIEAHRQLGDAKSKDAALASERGAFTTWCAAEREKLERARLDLAAAQQRLQREKDDHLAAVAAHGAAKEAFENAKAQHASELAELARVRKAFAA